MQKDNSYENKGKLDKAAVRQEMEYYHLILLRDRLEAEKKYSAEVTKLMNRICEEP